MKILLLLTTLLLANCTTSPTEAPNTQLETIESAIDFQSMNNTHTITIAPNTFSYWFTISIYDFKGGGYSNKNTSIHNIQHCFTTTQSTITLDKECLEYAFTDYADILAIHYYSDYEL